MTADTIDTGGELYLWEVEPNNTVSRNVSIHDELVGTGVYSLAYRESKNVLLSAGGAVFYMTDVGTFGTLGSTHMVFPLKQDC
jgi:hypothetical protein